MIHALILLVGLNAPFSHSIEVEQSITELAINISIDHIGRKFTLQSAEGFFAGKDTKVWLAKKNGNTFEYRLQNDVMEKVNNTFHFDEIASEMSNENYEKNSNITNNNPDHDVSPKLNTTTENQSSKVPEIVYPEILVYVDKTLFDHFNNDIVKTVAYIITLWNGVDLQFRDLEKPLVRLNIAGIVLCQDQVIPMNNFEIAETSRLQFAQFMYNTNQFKLKEDYDIAVLLGTNYKLKMSPTNKSNEGTSFKKRVCKKSSKCLGVTSTAIVTDNTALSGIQVAVHELANQFGAFYEHTNKTIKATRPWAKSCIQKNFDKYPFSQCSKQMMSHFLSSKKASCLLNNPAVNRNDRQLLRVLPAKYITYDEQCQKLGYKKASPVNINICSNMKCYNSFSKELTSRTALEGTPCGLNKYCLMRNCVNVAFDNANNLNTKLLFPKFRKPGFNKSAETQCMERKVKNIIYSHFESCIVHCIFKNNNGKIREKIIVAQLGTLCKSNGYCKDGICFKDINVSNNQHYSELTKKNNLVENDSENHLSKDVFTTNDVGTATKDNVRFDDNKERNILYYGRKAEINDSPWKHVNVSQLGNNTGNYHSNWQETSENPLSNYKSSLEPDDFGTSEKDNISYDNDYKNDYDYYNDYGNEEENGDSSWNHENVYQLGDNTENDHTNGEKSSENPLSNYKSSLEPNNVKTAKKNNINSDDYKKEDGSYSGNNTESNDSFLKLEKNYQLLDKTKNDLSNLEKKLDSYIMDIESSLKPIGKGNENWDDYKKEDILNADNNAGNDDSNWSANARNDIFNWDTNTGSDISNWGTNTRSNIYNWHTNTLNKFENLTKDLHRKFGFQF